MSSTAAALRRLMTRTDPARDRGDPATETLWSRAMDAAVETLSYALGVPVTVRERATTPCVASVYVVQHEAPGILVPCRAEGVAFFVRIEDRTAARVAALLLRAVAGSDETAGTSSLLDRLLVRQVLTCLLDAVGTPFKTGLVRDGDADELTEWPVELLTSDEKWSATRIEFGIGAEDRLTFHLLLPAGLDAFTGSPATEAATPTGTVLASQATVDLSVTVAEWSVAAQDVADLIGSGTIPLPEASLERMQVSVTAEDGTVPIAVGEHGRAGRHQAVRITGTQLSKVG